jgi:hypothetical protein
MNLDNVAVSAREIAPSIRAILAAQGVPEGAEVAYRSAATAHSALSVFIDLARPRAKVLSVATEDFARVFEGEGKNEYPNPLASLYTDATNLALFVVTVGEVVCKEIENMFLCDDFVVGCMLDATASEAAENLAKAAEKAYESTLRASGRLSADDGVLRFSPGYCGWHISAQRKLLDKIDPLNEVVRLNESYIMQPLKSVSGVVVCGPRRIFDFEDDYAFCAGCVSRSCRDRLREIAQQHT